MKVLQIAHDYFNTALYSRLFSSLAEYGVENVGLAAVPVNAQLKGELPPDFFTLRVSTLPRILFYPKQRQIAEFVKGMECYPSIDVIHAHTLFSAGYAARKLRQEKGTPYIVAVRNTDVNVFFKRMVHLRGAGVRIMQDAYRVIFLSPAYRDFVIERYVPSELQAGIREKSLVIPNGIDDYFLQNQPEPRGQISKPVSLLYVGEINSNKNLELIIQAADLLRQQGTDVFLTVVGNIMEEKYRSMIEGAPFVTYFPRCSKEDVLKHLRQSDLFVMPSHTETFGLVYAEAMSQGIPVLYTRGQGFDGQFPEGTVGYAVSDRDADDLAEKIRMVLSDYPNLSANCIKNASRFDWHKIAEEYRDIYQSAIQ